MFLKKIKINSNNIYASFIFLISILIEMRIGKIGGIQLGFLLFSLISILYLFFYSLTKKNFSLRNYHFNSFGWLYLFYIFFSIIWTVNVKETFLNAIVFAYVMILLSQRTNINFDKFIKTTISLLLFLAIISWLFYFLFGSLALSPKDVAWRLMGILGHEQRLAIFMGLGLILMTYMKLIKKVNYPSFFYIIFLITLIATQARAFIVFTIIIIFLIYFFEVKRNVKLLVLFIFTIFISILILFSNDLLSLVSRGDADMSLTGRVPIWEYTLQRAQEKPYLGFGFSTFMVEGVAEEIFLNYVAPHAHNTIVHSLFETGYIGTSILLLWMYQLGKTNESKETINRYIILFVFLCGLMGVVFGTKVNGVLLFVLALISISKNKN